MKKLVSHCPAFMQRLWFQLAVSYTLLAFLAMTVLIMGLYGYNDYKDFRGALTLNTVEMHIVSERLTVAQAIRDSDNPAWLKKARENIYEKLVNIETGVSVNSYRITNSSRPEVYIQILSSEGRVLLSEPTPFPQDIQKEFALHSSAAPVGSHVKWLSDRGPIWADIPVMDDNDRYVLGRMRVLYIAKFDPLVQFQSVLVFLFNAWDWVIICCIPIGIICGLVATRYVTKQLQKMNEVTESWRQGDFSARIALPKDDVLLRHSQHLNDMAKDLEMYMNLMQNMAVSDERNRVARELHDTVKQKLFALGLQLATAKAQPNVMESAGQNIIEAETITREAQQDLMEIITQLRPAGTSNTSLSDRINIIADDFRRRFNTTIELFHAGPAQLNAHAEHHILRIVQEALINAVRHGEATNIKITTKIDGDTATLTIVDNGGGFNTGKSTTGFGLSSMRDRMHDLPHGTFQIKSAVGAGTEITLSWDNEA